MIRAAAHMVINRMDGMRFLGADPRVPADDIEQTVMLWVNERVVKEIEKLNRG